MLILMLAAAVLPGFSSAIRPATPPVGWLSHKDYPVDAVINQRTGTARVRLEIKPDGSPSGCDVIDSSGVRSIDEATCLALLGRARFAPIRGPGDEPLAAVYSHTAVWTLPGIRNSVRPAAFDLEVGVTALPAGVKSPARITTQLIVGADGAIESCSADSGDAIPVLGKVACDQVKALLKARPARDASGAPVRSIQVAIVLFTAEQAPEKSAR
jgi:TonB family protein